MADPTEAQINRLVELEMERCGYSPYSDGPIGRFEYFRAKVEQRIADYEVEREYRRVLGDSNDRS